MQELLLFDDMVCRDGAYDEVASGLRASCLTDFVLLSADYERASQEVIFPHAIYIAFSSPLQGATSTQRKAIKRAIKWEHLDLPDENFLVAFGKKCNPIWSTLEIGYPEKLALMLQKQWHVNVVQRHGRYAINEKIVSDSELISQISMIEGGAVHYLCRTASPRFRLGWKKLKEETESVLQGNASWIIILASIFKSVERKRCDATVSIFAYCISDPAFGLARLARLGDSSYLPSFQVVISNGADVTILVGFLEWNGKCPSKSAGKWFDDLYGSFMEYGIRRHFWDLPSINQAALRSLGLQCSVYELINPGGEDEEVRFLSHDSRRLQRSNVPRNDLFEVTRMVDECHTFFSELIALFNENFMGWDRPIQ